MKGILRFLNICFQLILMLVLPFWLLIRGAIFLYEKYDWWYGFGIMATMAVVGFLLLIYVAMIWDAIFGPNKMSRKSIKGKMMFVLLLVVLYTGYTLFYLSGENTKSETVKKEYVSLHPFMRMAVGTFVFLDKDMLITDLSRAPEDYRKMGLPSKSKSLHYEQSSGYVHAMDLRTKGRTELRNQLIEYYFKILGFNTLRHTGTADHLHVSLSIKENPNAI
ncbi:MAG: hypothetical protein AAFR66_19170 [Bacteroidota bacterium]